MDSASCGPSNALTNLSKHAQRDNTLQNEAGARFGHMTGSNDFKSRNTHQIDANLNREFDNFQGNRFASDFQMQHPSFHQQGNVQQRNVQQGWVQDFSQLNINARPVQVQNNGIHNNQSQSIAHSHSHQRNDWQSQFMKQQSQVSNQGQSFHQSSQPGLQYRPQMTPFALNMRTDLSTPLTEHKEIHKNQQEQDMFDEQFNQMESELKELEAEQVEPTRSNTHNEEFAKTAQQVHDSMSSVKSPELQQRLQGSEFLKLMKSIADRDVELSGDKLVNASSGEDIRDHLPDPLREERSVSGSPSMQQHQHQPVRTEQPPMVSDQRAATNAPPVNQLPDPLAHIRDGGLEGINDPLMAAKVVSGNQIKNHHWTNSSNGGDDWLDMTEDAPMPRMNMNRPGAILEPHDQEMYDDYRHDDDYR
ncbi:hypothetical protein CAAN1_02S04808 [[Candida] anglica]|uniref:Peroxin 20 n=1 Tax=[Candida] anglica TaxID=148631 RepID=A0ABP0EGQ0_9ASCO